MKITTSDQPIYSESSTVIILPPKPRRPLPNLLAMPSPVEIAPQSKQEIERQCGTYLLRKGLQVIEEKDRDAIFNEIQARGLLPEI